MCKQVPDSQAWLRRTTQRFSRCSQEVDHRFADLGQQASRITAIALGPNSLDATLPMRLPTAFSAIAEDRSL
jgi:hypothetical protein